MKKKVKETVAGMVYRLAIKRPINQCTVIPTPLPKSEQPDANTPAIAPASADSAFNTLSFVNIDFNSFHMAIPFQLIQKFSDNFLQLVAQIRISVKRRVRLRAKVLHQVCPAFAIAHNETQFP